MRRTMARSVVGRPKKLKYVIQNRENIYVRRQFSCYQNNVSHQLKNNTLSCKHDIELMSARTRAEETNSLS